MKSKSTCPLISTRFSLLLLLSAAFASCTIPDQKLREQDDDGGDEFCLTFCDDSANACPFGEDGGYANEEKCLEDCAGYDDTDRECRAIELLQAADDGGESCPGTLLGGGGVCPDATPEACEVFCKDSASICPFGEQNSYLSENECRALCEGYSSEELNCRTVHLAFAEAEPAAHCPHTLEDGGGVCPDASPTACDDFCSKASAACPFGTDLGYDDESECLDVCLTLLDEALECRIVHVAFAEEDPNEHCPHIAEDGGGVCPDANE